jgi:hypothetical protein
MLDQVTRGFIKEIKKTLEAKLGRRLSCEEARGLETPRSYMAFEMILDHVKYETAAEELERYLAGLMTNAQSYGRSAPDKDNN